jgi:hypothetical protein
VAARGWRSCALPRRAGKLDGLGAWLRERFHRHRGNANVVRARTSSASTDRRQPADGRAGGAAPIDIPLLESLTHLARSPRQDAITILRSWISRRGD